MDGWYEIATVLRSRCHYRTWIGHVESATFDDTPAGPLNVVKRACEVMVTQDYLPDQRKTRWRHHSGSDCWVLEVSE